jgi:putative endonuclease
MQLSDLLAFLKGKALNGNIATGKRGEKVAEKHLKSNGYIILERGWRYRRMEIDLIVKKGKTIAFVEVKTRSSVKFGRATELVSYEQQKRIISAADVYLKQNNLKKFLVRYDVVFILTADSRKPEIEHIESAF